MNPTQLTLQGESVLDMRIRETLEIIEVAVKQSATVPLIINFSGGKDSLCLLDLVQRITNNFMCSYMVSGIEFPEAIDFVKETCSRLGVKLLLSYPSDYKGDFFERIAKFKRFPTIKSPWCNRDLKIRPQHKMLVKRYGNTRFFKLNAVRRFESTRRSIIYRNVPKMGFMRKEYQYAGEDMIVYPVLNWTNENVIEYLQGRKIEIRRNPLYQKYGVSGCYWCLFYQPSIYRRILSVNPRLYDPFIEWEIKLNSPSVNGFRWLRDIKKELLEEGDQQKP